MNWFDKILPPKIKTVNRIGRKGVPEGLWDKCTACQAVIYAVELRQGLQVCPKCNNHMRMGATERLESFLDEGSIEWIGEAVRPKDILKFRDEKKYKDRLQEARKGSNATEALVCASGRLKSVDVNAVAFEFKFMGGSMGSVVGERFARTAVSSLERGHPLVCFAASGGARMQEALFSLMQMSKTTAVISKLRERGIPYVSVLTDPTMGGVSASLAMLGDIIIAEPNALVGFAGPRVIEQTVRETLPEGFQRSEFLLEHGAIDRIIDRREMRDEIAAILALLGYAAPDDKPVQSGDDETGSQDPMDASDQSDTSPD